MAFLSCLPGMEFVGDFKTQVARLPSRIQEKMLFTVKQALMECPKMAWQMQPPTVTKMGDLNTIQLSILMQLDKGSKETFNRFADAIQELTTQLVKIGVVMGQVFAGSSTGVAGDSHTRIYG